jgi:hypothetical protein
VHQRLAVLTETGRMPQLDFAHALDHRLPEISEHDQRLPAHRTLIQHFPDDGEFDQRSGPTRAGDISAPALNQFEQPGLPSFHADLFVHPPVRAP